MSEARGEPKLWVSLFVVILLALVMQWLDFRGWLAGPEGRIADALLGRNGSSSGRQAKGSPISVIEIDDAAYDACFDSVSPMYANRVAGLVRGAALANPSVIGIDILTGARIRAAAYQTAAGHELGSLRSKLVWVAGMEKSKFEDTSFIPWLFGAEDELTVQPSGVLGFEPDELDSRREILWSVPVFPPDEDSGLRRFPRQVRISAGGEGAEPQTRPSWARLVAKEYCRSDPRCQDDSADEVLLSYSTDPPQEFAMLDLFDCDGNPKTSEGPWKKFQTGKIVLIGGTFQESGDFHRTPLRRRTAGVLVNAYAIQAEIGHLGIHEAWRPFAVGFDILIGLAIVSLEPLRNKVFKRKPRYEFHWILGGSAVLIALAFATTLLLFRRGYLMSFLGVALGVLLHQIWEMWNFKASEEPVHRI